MRRLPGAGRWGIGPILHHAAWQRRGRNCRDGRGSGEAGREAFGNQQAWLDEQVPQCGFCQPGFLIAVTALLATTPRPTDAEIDAAITNICRCGTYPRIRRAIHRAAAALA